MGLRSLEAIPENFPMKKATKPNRPQPRPRIPINNAHIIGGETEAQVMLKTLFEACGWKVVTLPKTNPPGKNPRKK